jgi:hypothetical protein
MFCLPNKMSIKALDEVGVLEAALYTFVGKTASITNAQCAVYQKIHETVLPMLAQAKTTVFGSPTDVLLPADFLTPVAHMDASVRYLA